MSDKKKIIEKPNRFLYSIGYHLIKPFLRIKCNASYDTSAMADLQGPALVLCPHISNMDFLLVAAALYPHRPTFVVSEHFMAKPKIRWLLAKMHVIPKKMFCPDIRTIMNIMRAKESGNVVVLFPEGRLTCVGHSLPVAEGTADLVKKLAVDVYTVTNNGAYKALPKWGQSGFRKGKIEVTSSKLFSGDEIAHMTVAEIEAAIADVILHDEDKILENVYYKCSAPAKGLDGILYKCPVCKSEFKMTADGHHIKCSDCGFAAELDNCYQLHGGPFNHINDWYFWQESEIDLSLPLESEAILATPGENGLLDRQAGYGKIYMDKDIISFTGTCFGEPLSFTEKVADVKALPLKVGDHFDIYHKKKLYNFIPQPDPRTTVKWSMYMDKVNK